jgi:predicted acetyltransferase
VTDRDFIFRYATEADESRLLDIFERSFGRRLSRQWWRWFNYTCPTGLNRTAVVVDPLANRIAASYSLLPVRLKINSQVRMASLATNAATDPDYRGRGLFTDLGRWILAREPEWGCDVSIGVPNLKARPGHMKVGWSTQCALPFLAAAPAKHPAHECRRVRVFDESFNALFERVAENYSFIVMKDHKFLNWRIFERPDKEYTAYFFERGSSPSGYVVLKTFEAGGSRRAHIIDMHALDEEALDHLIAAAMDYAVGHEDLTLWTNPRDPYREKLIARGFEERDGRDILIVHANRPTTELAPPGSWNFCLADNDVY